MGTAKGRGPSRLSLPSLSPSGRRSRLHASLVIAGRDLGYGFPQRR